MLASFVAIAWACGAPEVTPVTPAGSAPSAPSAPPAPRNAEEAVDAASATIAPTPPGSDPAPATEPPSDVTPTGESPSSDANASLSASDIVAVVQRVRAPLVRKCAPSLPPGSPPVRVVVKLTIGATGRVTSAQTDAADKALGACVLREMRALKFPSSSGDTKVSIPFLIRKN